MKADGRLQDLYEREYARVFRAAFILCGDRSAAEDSTQEAFARCLERWSRLKEETWVAGWVTSPALNHARRGLRRSRGPALATRSDRDIEASLDLWREIRALPKPQQEAVILRYHSDLPIADVARVMHCEEGTVKAHLSKARASLRRELSPQGPFFTSRRGARGLRPEWNARPHSPDPAPTGRFALWDR